MSGSMIYRQEAHSNMAKKKTPEKDPQQAPGGPVPPENEAGAAQTAAAEGANATIAALEEKLAAAEAETATLKDQMLRQAAEYDNFRRRSREEHDAAFNNGVAHAAEMLLPVLDVLNAAAYSPTTDEEYKKGVIMTLQKCDEIFKKLGIEEIDATGKPFDPELHNACMQEACEGVDSGCVGKVVQKGYTLNGRVIRHAMVSVVP